MAWSVFKRKYKGGKVAKKWSIDYTDEHGMTRRKPGYRDKKATEELARKLHLDAERKRMGLPVESDAPGPKAFTAAHQAYLDDLERQGRAKSHRDNCRKMIKRVADELGWRMLSDIQAPAMRQFLAGVIRDGRTPRTHNAYLGLTTTWLSWCVRQGWIASNPLAGLEKARDSGDEERGQLRRPFTEAEITALLSCEACQRRRAVYTVAAFTGFRRSTLARLRRRHLDITDPDRPLWRLPRTILKNRRAVVLPASPRAVAALAERHDLASMSPEEPLIERIPRMRTLIADLTRAGIVRANDVGEALVFHSFRYFFAWYCSERLRLSIQKVKVLMCHRDIAMTANVYMKIGLADVGKEVWTLQE